MLHSIKTKLVLTISALIVVMLSAAAFVLIGEKQRELTKDIFDKGRSFAELTAANIVSDYSLYLEQKSFVYFNRNIQDVFAKNVDIAAIQVVGYNGQIVYDSNTEKEKQYDGQTRNIQDTTLAEQVKSRNTSVKTLETKRVVYLKKNEDGAYSSVDFNEKPVGALAQDEKIQYLVQPASSDFSVVYTITYQALQDRINQTTMRILLLAVFGVGVGILMAILYAGTITKPVRKLKEGAEIFATGKFDYRVDVKTKDELETLANSFNKMAADLEVSTKALVYKERVAKELELAAKIQKQLLPTTMPKIKGLDVSAGLLPAEEIGGDCYDFIRLGEEKLMMYIGDVTGHGVPSGIVVSIANALAYHLAGKEDILNLMISMNKVIKEKTASNMFLTMVMLDWDAAANKLQFVNAGHEQMIHFHAKDKKVTLTPAGGLALGMFPDIGRLLKVQERVLEKDDVLVLYSDGIPESWKNEKEMYGMARFKRAVSEYSDLPSSIAIRNALLADVKEFSGKYKQMDDITLIVLKKTF
ncbi:MAG: SpoIIE family protein phosphatase [Candidatus Gracilibacteria bacterium]